MEMFEDIQRPRAENKVIDQIVASFEEGKKNYSKKNI